MSNSFWKRRRHWSVSSHEVSQGLATSGNDRRDVTVSQEKTASTPTSGASLRPELGTLGVARWRRRRAGSALALRRNPFPRTCGNTPCIGCQCGIAGEWPKATGDRVSASREPSNGPCYQNPCVLIGLESRLQPAYSADHDHDHGYMVPDMVPGRDSNWSYGIKPPPSAVSAISSKWACFSTT
jgi:hypothetical protein